MKVLKFDTGPDHLPRATRFLASAVDLSIADDDGMYVAGSDWHYLHCGASALNIILAAHGLADIPPPSSVLDFGAGAGRVTRWLRAAFPEAHISACDLRPEDMRFCRDHFGAEIWISGTDIAALSVPRRYDLIWVGSVLTHLSAPKARELIDKFLGWLNVSGVLVMSTIGRQAYTRRDSKGMAFIHERGWTSVVEGYAAHGYGYADYKNQAGYGLSLISLPWISTLVESLPSARLVLLAESVWDDLHDVVAVQSIAASPLAKVRVVPKAFRPAASALDWSRTALASQPTLSRAIQPLRSALRWVRQIRRA